MFSLVKEEVIVEAIELHKTNATTELLREALASDGEINLDGQPFKGGFVIPATTIDNLVPYYVIEKRVDEEDNDLPKPKYSEAFYIIHIEGKDTALLVCGKPNYHNGKVIGCNSGINELELRSLYQAVGSEVYTSSDFKEEMKKYYKTESGE